MGAGDLADERRPAGHGSTGVNEGAGLPRQAVALGPFTAADTGRLAELDRSESVSMLFTVRHGRIVPTGEGCEVPQWSGSWLAETIEFTRRHLEAGGAGVAAYDEAQLAGVAVLGGAPVGGDAGLLQLAMLQVGRPYRRWGIGSRLLAETRGEAARRGARRLYISATPADSALGFYLAHGARLAEPPDPGLLALEPEDVHLVLDLQGGRGAVRSSARGSPPIELEP
jgi:GNAT superfamily N-acetyltransferase